MATNFTVSVDGSPAVQYINFPNLVVDGLAGDDEIDIDVFALALTSLTVRGNNPSVDGDTLTVEGLAGADNATWTADRVRRRQLHGGCADHHRARRWNG